MPKCKSCETPMSLFKHGLGVAGPVKVFRCPKCGAMTTTVDRDVVNTQRESARLFRQVTAGRGMTRSL